MSHKKNKRRYLGTRSIEWMLGQIQNKSVSRGDICRFNDRDYVFNGKEWKLMSWNLSKSNNVKSDNSNAVSDVIQRMESAGTMDGQAAALKKKKNFKRECHGIYGNPMLDYCCTLGGKGNSREYNTVVDRTHPKRLHGYAVH